MKNMPDGRGLGTFIWEPTDWMEKIFDYRGNEAYTNSYVNVYDDIADDFGLR
jgi:arabinogalactan endo-1,4-beta-galactosidase